MLKQGGGMSYQKPALANRRPSAPEGRTEGSQGQGPWSIEQDDVAPRRGARRAFLAPLRGAGVGSSLSQGPCPWLPSVRPSGAEGRGKTADLLCRPAQSPPLQLPREVRRLLAVGV